ncbi:dTDP-4-dehydrorhamnose 3,5-epimerase [Thalassobaculum sp.]|uniref:dTDP-4-dehydrorhamnose 3,5-epimerase n=1 Tax=Thalassobaculum sp. TaxID=2022740 RepID=UPI003B5BC47A
MQVESLAIPDVKILTPKRFGDPRGFFSETYNKAAFAEHGLSLDFVQDNHSMSQAVGVLRGLHFQTPPFAQDKLVRVVKGRIFDVAVDIRQGSPTYGNWVGAEISAEAWNQILVPVGFAHGFVTLEPDTEVIYKVTAPYAPENDKGLAWDDPAIGIDWPLNGATPTLSDKDTKHPKLADLPAYFSI